MSGKHILFLTADFMGCGAYRCYTPARGLADTGRYHPSFLLHDDCYDEQGTINASQLEGIDALVIQRAAREPFNAWMDLAQQRGIPVIYETDDDVFHVPRHNPAYNPWGHKSTVKLSKRLLQRADYVICSTPPLKQALVDSAGIPASKVTVALNHLHPNIWGDDALGTQQWDNGSHIIIGWQGSGTHNADFTAAIPALQRVLNTFPQVTLRLFGYVPDSIRGRIPPKRFEWLKGVPFEQYPRNLKFANFDIGIAPLIDNRFNRAKSNIKFLEYSALGLPTVASNLTPYASTIKHGETGFIATTPDDWFKALTALITDPALRRRIGQTAHERVWADWGPARVQPWVDLFDRMLGG